ncbi:MAG TPA: hypothetical protein VG839_03500 [Asticcacaulis sp.]|nr:hypothetical protein [Asticcacaulis sp.]
MAAPRKNKSPLLTVFFMLTALPMSACAAPAPTASNTSSSQESAMADDSGGVAGLPFAKGRIFHSLDEYLAYRRELGKLDRPFYEEVSPGVYRLVARLRRPGEDKRYTRAELMAQFGFTH